MGNIAGFVDYDSETDKIGDLSDSEDSWHSSGSEKKDVKESTETKVSIDTEEESTKKKIAKPKAKCAPRKITKTEQGDDGNCTAKLTPKVKRAPRKIKRSKQDDDGEYTTKLTPKVKRAPRKIKRSKQDDDGEYVAESTSKPKSTPRKTKRSKNGGGENISKAKIDNKKIQDEGLRVEDVSNNRILII
jgi:hypothetical protein